MARIHGSLRTVIAIAAAATGAAVASCTGDSTSTAVLGPRLTGNATIFQSYVAIGNSITAGYQSGGISDATQRQAFPFLLAQQMGTRYAYPSLASVGCPPPIINFQTQARPTGTTSTTCALRNAASATDALNNVAVPGATSFDPTATSTAASNTLTTLFLGGKTQARRALDAHPTFVTVWIGNNDVLGPAVQDGRTAALAAMTSTADFQTNYDAMMGQLTAGASGLKGVLIGVVQVANAPIMFPAAALQNPQFKGGFDAIAGTTTALDPSCAPGGAGAASLINTFLAFQIRLGNHPAVIACVPGGASGTLPAPVGDILVLDPTEQGTVKTRIDAYNAYISDKATKLGFAYADPNPLLAALKAAGTLIRPAPNWAATGTFGTGMSLDGVHPAAGVQREVANALIAAINAKYQTTLQPVP